MPKQNNPGCNCSCGCTCTLDNITGYSGCNHPPTTLSLTGIGCSGGGTITISATSSNTAVVSTPTVTYTSPNATGMVSIDFVGEDQNSTITVTVSNGSCNVTKTALVAVGISSRPPFLNAGSLPASITLMNNAAPTTYNFNGVTESPDVNLAGTTGHCHAGGTGNITITAFSTNPGAVPNPTVTYTSPNATGSFAAAANFGTGGQTGTIFITVAQTNMITTGCCLFETVYSFPFTVT